VATGVASVALAAAAFPTLRGSAGDGTRWFDVPGALLFAATVTAALFALNRLPAHPADSVGLAAATAAGPLAAVTALWMLRRRHPFLEPRLVAKGRYVSFCVVGFLVQGMHFGAIVLLPLLWTRYHDLSFMEIGVHFAPGALALAFFGATGGVIVDRLGVRIPLIAGTWAASNAAMALFIAGVDWDHWEIAALYGVLAAGYGLANAGLLHGATSALSEEETGAGVGFYSLLFFLGGAVSSAAVGAILRAREGAGHAWLPLFEGQAPEFSDAFAVVAAMSAIAFVVALGLGGEAREANPHDATVSAALILERQKPIRTR
jgi:MFS family permease